MYRYYRLFNVVTMMVMISQSAFGQNRINFSILDAEPTIAQGKQEKRERPEFSIHDRMESEGKNRDERISFSVYDAKPIPIVDNTPPEPSSPLPKVPKIDCTPARQLNRVLVVHATKTEKKLVKVCQNGVCRVTLQDTGVLPLESLTFVSKLKMLHDKGDWFCGDTECCHFVLVDIDDPKNAKLIQELEVLRRDVPILIKETDLSRRKKATGLSAEDAAKVWNNWFKEEPKKEVQSELPMCIPRFGTDSHQYSWPGNLRQHLMDVHSEHHLPKAIVDSWTDGMCINWHNWHHEVLKGHKSVSKQSPSVVSPATSRPSKMSNGGQTSLNLRKIPSRYISGDNLESYAFQVAYNSARAPPTVRPSSSGKNGKKTREEKRWMESERKRIRREVSQKVWARVRISGFVDPFTIISVILTIIKILSFIFDAYNLN